MTNNDERPKQPISLVDKADPSKTDSSLKNPLLFLRRFAEKVLREKKIWPPQEQEALSPEETQRTVHELQIHQIEIEMQNDELRRTQVELESARARYFDLYDLAPVGYCTISEKGLILEANLTAADLLDVGRRTLPNQPFSRFILRGDQDIFYRLRKQLIETGESQSGELRLVRSTGISFWAQLEAAITQDETPVCRMVLSDISERKRDEEALKQLHLQNQEILDSITDACISVNDEMNVIYFNSAAERMFVRKQVDTMGRNLFDVFPEANGSIFKEKYSEAIRTKSPISFEVEFNLAPYQDWYGIRIYPRSEGSTIYFRVITKRKKADEAKVKLESVKRQLQKTESLGRMAGAIAHHFNNKLQVVRGYLELVVDRLPSGDTSKTDLTVAIQEADKAAEVSQSMLTYIGHVTEKREPLELSEVCRKILPLIEVTLPSNLLLKTILQIPSPVIKANSDQIRQIMVNLLTNAWEAIGDRQGTIDLTVKTVLTENIPGSFRFPIDWRPADTTYACLEIRDNGCGIADKDLEEVFSPFFSTKFTGRGMGLPVVLGLVKAHEGVITQDSSLEQGTVFRVFFPICAEAIKRPQKRAKTLKIQGTGKVLLVDDDEILLEVTSTMLSVMGFTVLRAIDGIEALEVYRQHKDEIRFVICDVTMPRMNGWETLHALRQIAPDFPVILASGFSEEQVMDGYHPEGPNAFLAKPYGFQALRETLNHIFPEAKE